MSLDIEFDNLDFQAIQGFVSDGREEDLHLEFKTISSPSLTRDDRKNLAKALSGFANSDGGLIIWGIVARSIDDVDVASASNLILELKKLISNLNSFSGKLVSPIVDNVRHKAIYQPGSNAIGFAVTIIPKSQSTPHMALGGEHRYYKRSGDSFYRMEHFDLEDMFGRRPRPDLKLYTKVTSGGGGSVTLVLGLHNQGKGIAKFPYLSLTTENPYSISKWELDGNGNSGLPRLMQHSPTPTSRHYGGSYDIVIYPDSYLQVTTVQIDTHNMKITCDSVMPDLVVCASYCAEGIPMRLEEYELSYEKIREKLFPNS